ncbi:MAG: flagellar hook-basal body complex protein [Phycisphaeraceae bacterium]|nr:flagellar hook-basal body complex protein [Phycisphaeraceae bacterium]
MNYGIQISSSGLLTSLYRQDVQANNLANMDSVAFKPDIPALMQRPAARQEDNLPFMPSDAMLERLGAGVLAAPTRVDLAQGGTKITNRSFDLAIEGEGFFQVQGGPSDTGRQALLTRDGRFARGVEGRLIHVNSGAPVLNRVQRPIILPQGDLKIAPDGRITVNGNEVDTIGVFNARDQQSITKRGGSILQAPAAQVRRMNNGAGLIKQGVLEESGVNEIKTMLLVQDASRDVDANMGIVQAQDRMLDRAINTFGRLA